MSCKNKDKTKFIWSRELVLCLIDLYQEMPYLYEVQNKEYKNKIKRQQAFEKIRDILKQQEFAANQCLNVEDIKSKIHILRTQYFKELRELQKTRTSGAGTDDIHKPKLWCFDQLEFLHNTDPVRSATSNLDINTHVVEEESQNEIIFEGTVDELNNEEIIISPPISRSSTPSTSRGQKNKKNQTPNMEIAKLITTATERLQKNQESKDDDAAAFGRMVEQELKKIKNTVIIKRVKRTIFNCLMDAQDEGDENMS